MLPLDLVRMIDEVFTRLRLPYFVTGSVASSFYGEFRSTRDVDVVIELPSWTVRELCAEFPAPAWYVDPEVVAHAAAEPGMFNIQHIPSGLKLDMIVFAGTPFDESRLFRARRIEIPNIGSAMFSSPEDVILKKLEFFKMGRSDKHPQDIAGMLKISGAEIDRAYIDYWASRLGVVDEWSAMKRRLASP